LRGEGTRTVGVSISLGDDYHARLLTGISNALWEKGYAPLYLHASNHPGFEEHKIFNGFMERRIDGAIARPVDYDEVKEFYEELIARGLPLVLIDCDIPGVDIPFSGTDNYLGGWMAAELLSSLGHKVIGHVRGFQLALPAGFRRKGFEDFFKNYPDVKLLFCDDVDTQISRIFLAKPRPTAVFAWNDHAAATIYGVAKKEKIRIPEDLSVIGFGDLSFARHMNPALTTFEQNPEKIAENAVDLFFGEISGNSKKRGNEKRRILVKPELLIRDSAIKNS
jgi:LacI family transcriptional regulator